MPLGNHCDYEIEPGRFCDKPPTWLALSASAPEMWADRGAGNATLGAFCSYFHAKAEPRPNLAAAKRVQAEVSDMVGSREPEVADGWQRAIDAYPKPVPYTA